MTNRSDVSTEGAPLSSVALALSDNRDRFLSFLERRLGNREQAEEVLQQALVTGLDRAGTVRNEESTVAWFYRLLRNALVDHYRRRSAEHRALAALAQEPVDANEHAALMNTVCQCVSSLVETLKPEYADAIKQLDLEQQSLAEFAAARGLSPNNAAVRAHRARNALRERLVRMCGGCAKHGCVDCTCC